MIPKALRFFTYWTALGALAVLAISAIFTPESLPKLQVCAFKQYTGRPCPGCGLTRAYCAISHGRFADAFAFNPFSFILYAATILMVLWPLLTHQFPSLKTWLNRTSFFNWFIPILLISMLTFGIIRIFMGSTV